MNSSVAIDFGLMSKATRCQTLDLNVSDGKIEWFHHKSDLSGANMLAHGDAEPKLDESCRETIELLSGLLQLLVDVCPKGEEQKRLVDAMLFRLAMRLGDALYAVLFDDAELRKLLNTALEGLRNGELELLRIELEFSGKNKDLASWPWEYLRRPEDEKVVGSGEFLALSANLVLNRSLLFQFKGQFSTTKPVLLLVVSSPRGLGPVEGGEVLKVVQNLDAAGRLILHSMIEPKFDDLRDSNYKPTASWQAFEAAVKEHKPHIIHFIGHGRLSYDQVEQKNIGELAFVGTNGEVDWRHEREFAGTVRNPNLRLVFLQACESALADPRANISGVAMQLAHQNIPAVIAMQAKVQNRVANAFAAKFYKMLSMHAPIDWAVKAGREEISLIEDLSQSQKLAFGVPVVYLSSYGGLFDQAMDVAPSHSTHRAPSHSRVPELQLTLEECPNCRHKLKDAVRQKSFCPRCKLVLRCPKCTLPLDEPDPDGCYCAGCGERIPPLADDGPAPAAGAQSPMEATAPSPPLLMPPAERDLQDALVRRFPSPPIGSD